MALKGSSRLFFKRFRGLNSYTNQENIPPDWWTRSMNVTVDANGTAVALRSPDAFNVAVGSALPVISMADYLSPITHKLLFDTYVPESQESPESPESAESSADEHGIVNTYTINDDLTNKLIRSDQYNFPFVSANVGDKLFRLNQMEFVQVQEDIETFYEVGLDAPVAAPAISYVVESDSSDSVSESVFSSVGSSPNSELLAEAVLVSIQMSYSYMNSTTGHVGIPSPLSNRLGPGGPAIQASVVASTEVGVDKLVFFFTLDDGAIPYLIIDSNGDPVTRANTTGNVTFNIEDMLWDTLTPEPIFNNRPPLGAQFMFVWKDRVILMDFVAGSDVLSSGLIYSGYESTYIGQPGESWPPLNQIYIPNRGEVLRGGIGTQTGALILSDLDAYLISGYPTDKTQGPEAQTSVTEHLEPLHWNIGTQSAKTIRNTPFGTMWFDHALRMRLWDGSGFPTEIAVPLRSELANIDRARLNECEGQWYQMGDQGGCYLMTAPITDGSRRLFIIALYEDSLTGEKQVSYSISDMEGFCLQPVRVFDNIRMFMGGIDQVFTIMDATQAGDGWPVGTEMFFEHVLGNDDTFSYWHSLRFDGSVNGLTVTVRNLGEAVAAARTVTVALDDEGGGSYYGIIDEYGHRKILRFEFDPNTGEESS